MPLQRGNNPRKESSTIDTESAPTWQELSPAPWAYEYNPYRVRLSGAAAETEFPAFEVFDDDGNKVFDTNADLPADVQEANARLAAAAPAMLAALLALVAADDSSRGCGERKQQRLDHAFDLARQAMAEIGNADEVNARIAA